MLDDISNKIADLILKGADWSEIYENNGREKGELTDGRSANG